MSIESKKDAGERFSSLEAISHSGALSKNDAPVPSSLSAKVNNATHSALEYLSLQTSQSSPLSLLSTAPNIRVDLSALESMPSVSLKKTLEASPPPLAIPPPASLSEKTAVENEGLRYRIVSKTILWGLITTEKRLEITTHTGEKLTYSIRVKQPKEKLVKANALKAEKRWVPLKIDGKNGKPDYYVMANIGSLLKNVGLAKADVRKLAKRSGHLEDAIKKIVQGSSSSEKALSHMLTKKTKEEINLSTFRTKSKNLKVMEKSAEGASIKTYYANASMLASNLGMSIEAVKKLASQGKVSVEINSARFGKRGIVSVLSTEENLRATALKIAQTFLSNTPNPHLNQGITRHKIDKISNLEALMTPNGQLFIADLSKKIGEGTFKAVHMGFSVNSNSAQPTKTAIGLEHTPSDVKSSAEQEWLLKLQGRGLVKSSLHNISLLDLHKMKLPDHREVFFTDFYNGGELVKHYDNIQFQLKTAPAKAMGMLSSIFLDLATGLETIHQLGGIHRDIKPENILVKVDDAGLIQESVHADYGSVIGVENASEGNIEGTPCFFSPEICANGDLSEDLSPEKWSAWLRNISSRQSDDIWALGLTFAEMLLGMHDNRVEALRAAAMQAKDWIGLEAEVKRQKLATLLPPLPEVSLNAAPEERAKLEMYKLLSGMLSLVTEERYTAAQVLEKCQLISRIMHPVVPV